MTELIIAIIVLVLAGTIISKEAVSQTKRKADIEKIQATYNLLEKSAMAWQSENDCYDDIKVCVQNAKGTGMPINKIFDGVAKYMPVVASSNTFDAKGRHIEGEYYSKITWLPESTRTYDGNIQTDSTIGVSKYYDRNTKNISYYKLRNGVTIAVNFVEIGGAGYGFFDIDGSAGENRIGADVYPFSIGSNVEESSRLYETTAKKFNPYFSSDKYDSLDICNINKDNCTNEKLATNPTVYVLKWNKLP